MSRMVQLNRGQTTAFSYGRSHLAQAWQMIVAMDSKLPGKSDTTRLDGSGASGYQRVFAL
jgi:hypothetical protein